MKVFVSHGSVDSHDADQLVDRIESAGAEAWIDQKNIDGGDKIDDEIFEAIQESDEVVVIFSPLVLDSTWVWAEVGAALALGKRLNIILTSLRPDDLHRSARTPIFVQRSKMLTMGELDKFESQLKQRVIERKSELLPAASRRKIRNLKVSTKEGVTIVELARRDNTANALNTTVLKELVQIIAETRAPFILASKGNCFSGGLDLEDVYRYGNVGDHLELLFNVFEGLRRHPYPTASFVNGRTVAGGVGLALNMDVVIAQKSASLRLPSDPRYRKLAEVLVPVISKRRGIEPESLDPLFDQAMPAEKAKKAKLVDSVADFPNRFSLVEAIKNEWTARQISGSENLEERYDDHVSKNMRKNIADALEEGDEIMEAIGAWVHRRLSR